jgi:hypothetical protein
LDLLQAHVPPSNGTENVLRIHCPECGNGLRLRPGMAGFRVRCIRCRHVFRAAPADDPAISLRSRLLLEVRQTRSYEREPPPPRRAPLPLATPAPAEPKQVPPVPLLSEPKPAPHREPPPPPEPEQAPELPEDIELAQLGRLPRRSTKPGRGNYRKVLLGLTLNLAAAALLLATFAIGLIVVLTSAQAIYAATDPLVRPETAAEPKGPIPLGFLCLGVLVVISEGTHVLGLGYCLGAPRKDSARPLALATLIGGAVGLPLVCVGGGLRLAIGTGLGTALLVLGLLLLCASKVLYLVFLRALGLAMEMRTMAGQIYLIIALVLLAGFFHLAVLTGCGFGLTGDILGVVSGRGTGAGLQGVSLTALLFWGASWLILLYALIRFILTIYEARGHVKYHRACRHEFDG